MKVNIEVRPNIDRDNFTEVMYLLGYNKRKM